MKTTVSYSEARARLAELWDEAADTREPIVLRRRGKEDMALIAADELAGMLRRCTCCARQITLGGYWRL